MPRPEFHRLRGRFTTEQIRAGLAVVSNARGETPLVVECRRVGDYGETRAPGIHYDDPVNRRGAVIVFTGDEPPAEWLAHFKPPDGPGPLFISLGPCEIEPPADTP